MLRVISYKFISVKPRERFFFILFFARERVGPFNNLALQKMLPAFTTCTSELISRWEESMGAGKAKEIDVWPELQDLTGDAISRAAFGSSISEGRRIFRVQSEQAQLLTHMTNLYIPGYTYVCSYYSPEFQNLHTIFFALQTHSSNANIHVFPIPTIPSKD